MVKPGLLALAGRRSTPTTYEPPALPSENLSKGNIVSRASEGLMELFQDHLGQFLEAGRINCLIR